VKGKRPTPPADTCIIYTRVSTEPQSRKVSLATQQAANVAHAERQGWTIIGSFEETGSRADLDRPVLTHIRELLRQGQAATVLSYCVDRLSCNQNHIGVLLDEAERYGVAYMFATESFEKTETGRLLLAVKTYTAAIDREKILERTTRGKKGKLRQGQLLRPKVPLYGYFFEQGRRVINEEEAVFVREIFRRCAVEHEGTRHITQALNASGYRTRAGTLWAFASIWRMLREPAYKGETIAWRWEANGYNRSSHRRSMDEAIRLPEGVTPAIVSPGLWGEAQAFLTRNRGERTRNTTRPYLLRGLASCGTCGLKLYTLPPANGAKGPSYRCASHNRPTGWCGARSIQAPVFETSVIDALIELLRTPALIHSAIQMWREALPQGQRVELERTQAQLRQTEQRQARLVRAMAEADGVASTTFQAELRRLEAERVALVNTLAGMESAVAAQEWAQAIEADPEALCRRWQGRLEHMDFERKRKVLEALAARITLGDQEIVIHGRLPVEVEMETTGSQSLRRATQQLRNRTILLVSPSQ
jgi:site-specific DNA recombinase